MDENDEKTAEETETPEEATQAEETGETPVEAHRAGEFDALADKLDKLNAKMDDMIRTLTTLVSASDDFTDNPETIDDIEVIGYGDGVEDLDLL